jgi:hypothetical protein
MLRKAIPALIWPTLHACEKGGLRLEKVIVMGWKDILTGDIREPRDATGTLRVPKTR